VLKFSPRRADALIEAQPEWMKTVINGMILKNIPNKKFSSILDVFRLFKLASQMRTTRIKTRQVVKKEHSRKNTMKNLKIIKITKKKKKLVPTS
jgi:hypothetical protein